MSRAKVNPPSHLRRAILLDLCKDGTLTYRDRGRPSFNAIALPVFSVDTAEQAEAMQAHFCRLQYREHPQMPGKPWYRLSVLLDGTDPAFTRTEDGLQLDDLFDTTTMLRDFWTTKMGQMP